MGPTVLNSIADLAEILDALIERNDMSDFFAHFPTSFAIEQLSALRMSGNGNVPENFPFGPGFANLARNLGCEHDAPLGAGFCTAIVLLITRFSRQENDFFLRRD